MFFFFPLCIQTALVKKQGHVWMSEDSAASVFPRGQLLSFNSQVWMWVCSVVFLPNDVITKSFPEWGRTKGCIPQHLTEPEKSELDWMWEINEGQSWPNVWYEDPPSWAETFPAFCGFLLGSTIYDSVGQSHLHINTEWLVCQVCLMPGHPGIYCNDSFITLLCKKFKTSFPVFEELIIYLGGWYIAKYYVQVWIRKAQLFRPGLRPEHDNSTQ